MRFGGNLQTWLDFFNGADSLSAPAAQAIVRSHSSTTCKSRSSRLTHGWKGENSRQSNRGLSSSGAKSSPNCIRCTA